jgi:tRNA(Ile)-lysidine synthase
MLLQLDLTIEAKLRDSKNLLAFSAGVDSSALFFLLKAYKIKFDIALVNYGLRDSAFKEQQHAIELSKIHNLKCYTIQAPSYENNFEKNARDFRYDFFDKIVAEYHYDNLLTAHQLNDQLEWFLMRLTKGAGVVELLGLEPLSEREHYTLIRPLLNHSKEELLLYLKSNKLPYFVDKSNYEDKYERNRFRKEFSDKLLKVNREGIKRSFDYLRVDKKEILSDYRELFHYKELYVLHYKTAIIKTRLIDRYLKKLGYLLSGNQRKELIKSHSIVLGGKWAVEIIEEKIFISPYRKSIKKMDKKFKEECRVLKIPSKIRAYLYEERLSPKALLEKI